MPMPELIQPTTIQVYPYGRHGAFAAFVCDGARCACGMTRLLRPGLIISQQPLIDAARMLLAAGVDPDAAIIMTHGTAGDIALRSTVGKATALVMTSSRHGTPIAAKPKMPGRGSHCTANSLPVAHTSSPRPPRSEDEAGSAALAHSVSADRPVRIAA